jgi:hypothetical protein
MSSCEETETKQGHTATTVQCGAREGGREDTLLETEKRGNNDLTNSSS